MDLGIRSRSLCGGNVGAFLRTKHTPKMHTRYAGDPYWTTVRFNSTCHCGQPIRKGDRGFYYPKGKVMNCSKCSDKASSEFTAAAQDEDFMNGTSY